MPSNFDFLRPKWANLLDDAMQVERQSLAGPRTCAFYARRVLERMLQWLYANNGDLRAPYQENLAAMLHEPSFQDILPPGMRLAVKLLHLPDEPAGVERRAMADVAIAAKLVQLPDEPAGVKLCKPHTHQVRE